MTFCAQQQLSESRIYCDDFFVVISYYKVEIYIHKKYRWEVILNKVYKLLYFCVWFNIFINIPVMLYILKIAYLFLHQRSKRPYIQGYFLKRKNNDSVKNGVHLSNILSCPTNLKLVVNGKRNGKL